MFVSNTCLEIGYVFKSLLTSDWIAQFSERRKIKYNQRTRAVEHWFVCEFYFLAALKSFSISWRTREKENEIRKYCLNCKKGTVI